MSRATPPISSASGHRVAAAVARAIANPCGILHREGLVDTARGAAPGPDSYEWLLRLNTFARFSRVESEHLGEGLQRAGIAPSGPGVTRRQPAPRGASPKLILAAGALLLSLSAATTVGATSPEVRSWPAGPVRRRVSRLRLGGLVSFLDSISGPSGARSSSGVPGWCAANVLRRGCGDGVSRSDERASRQHDPPAQADRAARSARGRGRGLCRKSDGQRCGSGLGSGPAGVARAASGKDPVAALCQERAGAHDQRSRRPQPPGAGQSNLATPW